MVVSAWQAYPVKDSRVYQELVSSSNVVYNLTVENTVTVSHMACGDHWACSF